MRIAIFHNSPSGGAKRALYEITKRLAHRHQIDVYTLSCANHSYADLRPHVLQHPVFPFKEIPLFSHPLGLLNHGVRALDILRISRLQKHIASEIDRAGYDVALVSNDRITNSPPILRYLTTPAVYYCQDPLRKIYDPIISRPYSQVTGLRSWVDRANLLRPLYLAISKRCDAASLRAADLVLVNSYFSRESIYRLYGVSPRVCYLGIDHERFRPLGLEKEEYVLSVGSVNPIKGFDFLIDALALVPAPLRPSLLIVGNFAVPEEQGFLLARAQRLGVQLSFRVMVSDEELVELYDRAICTLYAPILEPFGLVPLESMACGTPVIGVAEGGVRETILHGETGLLTDREPREFGEAITRCLSQPEQLEALGAQGPAYVRDHWSWDECVTRIEGYLRELAGEESGAKSD